MRKTLLEDVYHGHLPGGGDLRELAVPDEEVLEKHRKEGGCPIIKNSLNSCWGHLKSRRMNKK